MNLQYPRRTNRWGLVRVLRLPDEYPYTEKIESEFQTVLREFSHILPDIASTTWRKKSDFYMLFWCSRTASPRFRCQSWESESEQEAAGLWRCRRYLHIYRKGW